MSLSCDCSSDYGPELWQTRWQRARKEHSCVECRHPINIGDTYKGTFMVFEGDARYFKECERCADLGEALADLGFCWPLGDLATAHLEYIQEYVPWAWSADEETQLWNGRELHTYDIRRPRA